MPTTFQFPIEYPADINNFPEALEKKFEEYQQFLHELGCSTEVINKTKIISNRIIESINKYYTGRVHAAYQIFIDTMSKYCLNDKPIFIDTINDKTLFRARKEKIGQEIDFEKDDMFHIKFENRTKVRNQRFSISGLPCLYMAESLFACWVEMNRPSLDIFTAASIDITKCVNVFDMCKVYDIFVQREKKSIEQYASFINILIAISFSVRDKQGEFKPEYIIPQFIMQWILDNKYKISGIKYYCTSICPDLNNKRLFVNYAFPAKENNSSGFCKFLEKNFIIKRIVSGRCIQYYNKKSNIFYNNRPPQNDESVEISRGLKRNYKNSIFGIYEDVLTIAPECMDDGDFAVSH